MFAKPRPRVTTVCGCRTFRRRLAVPGLLALWLLLFATPLFTTPLFAIPLFAANPPPVQIFYIPAPEDDGFAALQGIFPGANRFPDISEPIMATDDDTLVEVDVNADGTFEDVVTLDEGENHLTVGTVREGARVRTSAPVQAGLITGDINDTYEARAFVLFPEEQWSNRYYSPVSTSASNGTTAFLYNPHATPMTVTRTIAGGGTSNTIIQAMSGISMPVVAGSGARFTSTDGRSFAALVAIDSTDAFNSFGDWGFAMIPESQLTMQTLIGWGPGKDPDSIIVENSSPVWVIPVNGDSQVEICVDYDGDNAGPLTDANGFRYDERFTLDALETAQAFDPDGDQTGALLYVCTNVPNQTPTVRLAATWGQDPDIASPDEPALDLGTTAPPAATFEAGKSAEVVVDLDGDGEADAGDTLRYSISIRNASRVPINGVTISDTVPLHTSYVLSSTTLNTGSGPTAVEDHGVGTPFPLDEGGIPLGNLPMRGIFTVTFAVLLDNPLPGDIDRVRNVAIVRVNGEERKPEVETPLDFDPALDVVKLTNGSLATVAPGVLLRAGDPVTWTYLVTNTGAISITSLSVTDSEPGVTPTQTGGDIGLPGVFDVGESRIYAATGVAVAGQYSNTVTVVGLSAGGEAVTNTAISHYFGVSATVGIDKQASASSVRSGSTVTYTYGVSSTGNVPLVNVAVSDDRCLAVTAVVSGTANVGDGDADNTLDIGELWQFTCSTPLTTTTTNIATVSAVEPLSTTVTATDTATVAALGPGIILDKATSEPYARAGSSVEFAFKVENIGTDVLTNVVLIDNQCAVSPTNGDMGNDGLMEVAEVWTYTCTRVLTRTTTNVAVVTAVDSFGETITATDAVTVIVPLLYLPQLHKGPTVVPCPPPDGCPLANEIKALAVNETTNRLYVVARDPDELLLVDPINNTILDRAPTGAQPWGVAVDEGANRVYVSSFAGNDIRIYDGTTLELLRTIPVDGNASVIEHLPGTNTVFALNYSSSRVLVIEGLDVVQDLSTMGSAPFGLAVDAVNQRLFISHRVSASLSMVRKVNGQWQAIMGPQVDDNRQFFDIAYSAADNRLFALWADPESNWFLDVWEPKENDIWGRFSTQSVASGGNINDPNVGGAGLEVNGTTRNLFNVNTGSESLSVFDAVALVEIEAVALGDDPFALAIDESRSQVYVGLRAGGRLIKLVDNF